MQWQRPARTLALLLLLGLLCGEAVGKPTVKKTAAGNAKKAAAGNAKQSSSRPRTSALQVSNLLVLTNCWYCIVLAMGYVDKSMAKTCP